MRITGGAARSIQLKTLDLDELRPAADAVRQSLFNSLGDVVVDARFLDLFAGCGAYGLEAFSRGAAGGVFVERHPKLKPIILQNIAAVSKSAQRDASDCQVRTADVLKYFPEEAQAFDIIFCDPPYAMIESTLAAYLPLVRAALKPGGLWLMEHPAGIKLIIPEGFEERKTLGGRGERAPNVTILKRQA